MLFACFPFFSPTLSPASIFRTPVIFQCDYLIFFYFPCFLSNLLSFLRVFNLLVPFFLLLPSLIFPALSSISSHISRPSPHPPLVIEEPDRTVLVTEGEAVPDPQAVLFTGAVHRGLQLVLSAVGGLRHLGGVGVEKIPTTNRRVGG